MFIENPEHVFIDTRCKEAQAFILENLRTPHSIDSIAKHVKLSRAQLSALFKRSSGQSITQWTNDRRMALAVQALLHTDHSVAAIADEVGFEDPLYFSRKFKSSIGLSPREYRRTHAGTDQL